MSVAPSRVSLLEIFFRVPVQQTFEGMHYHIQTIVQQQYLQLLGPQGFRTERVQRLHLVIVTRGGHGDDLKVQLWVRGDQGVADDVGLYESEIGGAGTDVDRFIGGGRPCGGERCSGHWRRFG